MAIADRLTKLTTDITNAYASIENKGGTIPANKNTNNLSTAIDSIEVIEQATAEGESLNLANTKAMPYSDYAVKGKGEQATSTQSANLFDENKYRNASYNTNVYKYTLTNIKGNRTLYTKCSLKSGKTSISGLYLAICNKNNPNLTGNITAWLVNGGNVNVNNHADFSNDEDIYLTFYPANTSIQDIFDTYNIMVSTDNVNYEPFTPNSPSPAYPSEIHSVADDVNLFDVITATANQSNYVLNSNETITNNKSYGSDGRTFFNNILLNAGTYTISYIPNLSGTTKNIRFSIKNIDSSTDIINQSISITNETKQTFSFTLSSNTNIAMCIMANGANDGIITLKNIKLQKGTVATPYSPYNQGTVTTKQRGKNEFNTSNIISSATDYTITVQDGGFIIRTGGISNGGNLGLLKDLCPELKVGDKFKFTWDSNATRNNSDVNYIYLNLYANTIRKDITYTCTQEMLDSETYFYGQQGEYYKNIIFYLDGQTSDYEPYQANDYTFQTEPLRSLPNGVKDTIEADGIHRRVGRVVLDGSESWTEGGTQYTGLYSAYVNKDDMKKQEGYSGDLLSNYFKENDFLTQEEGITKSSNPTTFALVFIRLSNDKATNMTTFKSWLSNNPTEVLYELQTEIIEPLTQNQATTMLDIIKTGSYEGTTNIYTDEDVKPTIGVDYYKKG